MQRLETKVTLVEQTVEEMIESGAEQETQHRLARLQQILRGCGSVCVGYSGGVDSVFLAKVALDTLGASNVLAVTGRSPAYPDVQRDVALECSRDFGIPHLEIDTDELNDPNYAANPSNRCYFCKSELWTQLRRVADERNIAEVLDGSNADDAHDYRPGMQAARERAVRSPLLEAGLTKADIRALSQRLGLPTWDQPSAPCLSSRLPYGLAVTPQRLREVESAEAAVRALGFRDFRVRHHGNAARIEMPARELPSAVARARELSDAVINAGFTRVLLDVEGYRRGSLNEGLAAQELVQLGVRATSGASATGSASAPGSAGAAAIASAANSAPAPHDTQWTAHIEPAGHQEEIAVIPSDVALAQLAKRAVIAKERGFRYAAIDLVMC
jgi:uncharacterized protein